MSNLTKPPILDDTGQDILSALADIKRNLPQGGSSNGYAPTDATESTLADDDKVPFYDTSASGKRNSTWANIKAKLKAYCDTIYATISDLASKADNVSVSAKVPSGYGSHGIPKFSQYTGISTDLENLPDVVDDISEALYDSINAHGDLFSSISAQSKGTYNNKTYNSTLHEFDVTTVETDKTAVYMAGDINTKLGTAIADHAAAMIKPSYPLSVYDDTTHKMETSPVSMGYATPIDMIDNIQTALEDAVDDHADLIAAKPDDLIDLGDVAVSSPTNGQVLKYNSTTQKWENGTGGGGASALNDLSDVSLGTLLNADNLVYNSTSGEWENTPIRIEKTMAEFNQLSQAEKDDPRFTYYVTDKPSLGYPIQDDGTATDLTDGALATGRTIENWAKKPTLVSYSDVTIATGITMRFELFSNGTKTVSVGSNTLSNALIQLAAGSIPTIYRPITTGAKYFTGSTSAYETNGTRMIAITPDGRIIIYKSPNAGLYICANYI